MRTKTTWLLTTLALMLIVTSLSIAQTETTSQKSVPLTREQQAFFEGRSASEPSVGRGSSRQEINDAAVAAGLENGRQYSEQQRSTTRIRSSRGVGKLIGLLVAGLIVGGKFLIRLLRR